MHRSKRSRFLSILVLACAGLVGLSAAPRANPPNVPGGWHKVFQFNLIGYPGKDYTGGCGAGNRVFVNRDDKGATMLVTNGTTWNITDCNATGDHRAEMTTVDVAKYAIFVRILGKPGGTLHACADSLVDFAAGDTLCLLGTIDLTRGKGQSKFDIAPSTMFDASLEDIIWTMDTNSDFRIAQFRVYEMPALAAQ